MITSESRRASPLSLRAVKLWLSLISFSPFVFFDHPHYWGRIQIVTFPPGRKSGCLHTPRVCSPRTVEGGTSNRPSCPWPKNLFQARGSVKVQNRKRVSVTFENICKRAQCFFPRPFGSAAPRLSFTIKKSFLWKNNMRDEVTEHDQATCPADASCRSVGTRATPRWELATCSRTIWELRARLISTWKQENHKLVKMMIVPGKESCGILSCKNCPRRGRGKKNLQR